MLNLSNLQDTKFLESPASELFRKLPVCSRNCRLGLGRLDRRSEPLVLKSLRRSENSEASRVSRLQCRYQCQLRASRKAVLDGKRVILGVVTISGFGSSENWSEERAGISEGLSHWAGESYDTFTGEVGFHIWSHGIGEGQEEDVVLLGGGDGVVVEVVNHN